MKVRIGYPCINLSLKCRSTHTFRLRAYSREKMEQTIAQNLRCLRETISWNIQHQIGFFRISSDLIPFASHPVCKYPWWKIFRSEFQRIGNLIRKSRMRIAMHPDQFVIINALDPQIFISSVRELVYHARVLDLMKLPLTAKIQIHVGAAYGNKEASIKRFAERYQRLPARVKRRLVIENDDRLYTVSDCLAVHRRTGIPVVFDSFHHEVNPDGTDLTTAFQRCARTWRYRDGVPIVDYSSQQPNARAGSHAMHINLIHFRSFIKLLGDYEFDLMLEIKDKENSALKAQEWLRHRQEEKI